MSRPKNVWDKKRGVWQPRLSEEMVLKEVVERLWLQARIKVWRIRERIPGAGRLSTAGLPDLVGAAPGGTAIFLEIKRPRGVHRPAQELFINEVKGLGAIAGFCHSWDDAVALFGEHGINLSGGS